MFWKQKSIIHYLKEGDKKSKFFHNSLLQRIIRNQIALLRSTEGIIKEKQEDIEEGLTNYYKNLMSNPNTNRDVAIKKLT